ncbi:MAG: hypothetical protein IJ523_07200 [Succinivibrionaceae bacterium]|nr:hypothetical protein [Succinivibrionaceae bacterium]
MKIDVKNLANKGKLTMKQHSPEILVVTGIVGVVVSAVMACKATRKLDPVLEAHKQSAEAVHKKYAAGKDDHAEKRELTGVYLKTGVGIVKLYGPSVTIGALSIAGILTGNNILRKRNMALAAAYATIDASYKQYRGRVIEKFGEEVDKELRFGSHQEKIEVVETDENGKEKKVKKDITVMGSGLSDYARYFCVGEAKAAEPNSDYNAFFLKAQEELANHMLRANCFLFLNDVYDMLGIDKSIAGQAVGWVYDKNADDHGDNYVDFGIQEVYRKRSDNPEDYEKVFLLDFNVDGNILDHAQNKGLITD